MIRINLLPVSRARRVEGLIIQAIIGALIILGVTFGCYVVSAAKRKAVEDINRAKIERQEEIKKLEAQVGEVKKFKQRAQELEKQLGVIRNLEKGRSGPVKLLDEMTELVPRKLWLVSMKETNKNMTIEAVADSGSVIADFMDGLKASKFFTNVQLGAVNAFLTEGVNLQRFTLSMQVKYDL